MMSLTINRLKEVSWDSSSPSLRVLPNIPEHDLHEKETSCNILVGPEHCHLCASTNGDDLNR